MQQNLQIMLNSCGAIFSILLLDIVVLFPHQDI